jgi:hypothetical protein
MTHPDHDAVVDAFRRVGAPTNQCDRGGPGGYTHVHGPSQQVHPDRCTTHAVCVEKQNGTVAVRSPVGEMLGGRRRPDLPIARHPLGYSHRPDYGQFDHAFDLPAIRANWPTLDAFARDVIAAANTHLGGW